MKLIYGNPFVAGRTTDEICAIIKLEDMRMYVLCTSFEIFDSGNSFHSF